MAQINYLIDPAGTVGVDGVTHTSMDSMFTSIEDDHSDLDGDGDNVEAQYQSTGTHPADTSSAILSGVTTSATNNITIKAVSGHECLGIWDDSKYRLDYQGTGDHAFRIEVDHTKIYDLASRRTTGNGYDTALSRAADYVQFFNCLGIIDKTSGSSSTDSVINSYSSEGEFTTDPFFVNCIAVGDEGDCTGLYIQGSGSYDYAAAYNCTVINCSTGIRDTRYYHGIFKNCISYNNSSVDYTGNFDDTYSTNNLSEDSTAPGSDPQTNASVTFVTDTYQPDGNGDAIGNGVNLYSDFTDDIAGNTRPSTGDWDIGAWVAATGGSTYQCEVTDELSISDSCAALLVVNVQTTDGISINDAVQGGQSIQLEVVDSFVSYDSVSASSIIQTQAEEQASFSDSIDSSMTFIFEVQDGVDLDDTVDSIMSLFANINDGMTLSEFVSILDVSDLPVSMTMAFTSKSGGVTFVSKSGNITFTTEN